MLLGYQFVQEVQKLFGFLNQIPSDSELYYKEFWDELPRTSKENDLIERYLLLGY